MHGQGSSHEYVLRLRSSLRFSLYTLPPLFYLSTSLEITLRIQREPGTRFPEAPKANSPEGRARTGDFLAVGPSRVTSHPSASFSEASQMFFHLIWYGARSTERTNHTETIIILSISERREILI